MFLNVLKLKDVLPVDYYVKMVLVPIHLKTVLKSIALLIYHINVMTDSVLLKQNSVILIMDVHLIKLINAQMENVCQT